MKVIFNDILQYSDADSSLISPSLADSITFQTVTINLDQERTFDSFGIGNTDADSITINGDNVVLGTEDKNGLYELSAPITTDTVTITFTSPFRVGRLALGVARKLGAAPAREPGFWSTHKPDTTLSGQVVEGEGGVTGRILSVDFRYKVNRDIFDDIEEAYPSQLGKGYPLFMNFPTTTEQNRFPWVRFYGKVPHAKTIFQSAVNYFAYSKKMTFEERF